MAVKEYIDDTYNRAMFKDRPSQPQTMDQGPSGNTGIMEGFEQTEEQQQGMIDQAEDLNGLVAATRGAEIPEEELRKEAQAIMTQSMGEDKATAVAALISPDILVAMQPLIQSMYDDSGINSLIETEDAAPQMQQEAGVPMQGPQAVPGMAGGGIVKLAKGGSLDLSDPYKYLRAREEPDWEAEQERLTKAYEDIGTSAMDKKQLQGIILMDVAKQILSLGARGEGTAVDKFIKGAQSTSDLIQQLSISQGKIKGEEKREAKIKGLEQTEEKRKEFIEEETEKEKSLLKLGSEFQTVYSPKDRGNITVSKADIIQAPKGAYLPKKTRGKLEKGRYNYANDAYVIAEAENLRAQGKNAEADKLINDAKTLKDKIVDIKYDDQDRLWVPDYVIGEDGVARSRIDPDTGVIAYREADPGAMQVFTGAQMDISGTLPLEGKDLNKLTTNWIKNRSGIVFIDRILAYEKDRPGRLGSIGNLRRRVQTFTQILGKDASTLLTDVKSQEQWGLDERLRSTDLGTRVIALEENPFMKKILEGTFEEGTREHEQQQRLRDYLIFSDALPDKYGLSKDQKEARKKELMEEHGLSQETYFTEEITRDKFADRSEDAKLDGERAYGVIMGSNEGKIGDNEFDQLMGDNVDEVYKNFHFYTADSDFDKALPEIRAMLKNIVYAIARTRKPNGRLNLNDVQNAAEPLTGIKSVADMEAVLGIFKQELEAANESLADTFFAARGGTSAGKEAHIEHFYDPNMPGGIRQQRKKSLDKFMRGETTETEKPRLRRNEEGEWEFK